MKQTAMTLLTVALALQATIAFAGDKPKKEKAAKIAITLQDKDVNCRITSKEIDEVLNKIKGKTGVKLDNVLCGIGDGRMELSLQDAKKISLLQFTGDEASEAITLLNGWATFLKTAYPTHITGTFKLGTIAADKKSAKVILAKVDGTSNEYQIELGVTLTKNKSN